MRPVLMFLNSIVIESPMKFTQPSMMAIIFIYCLVS